MPEQTNERIAALETRIASLEEELARLKVDVGAAQGRVKLTMRGQRRCPSCGSTKLVYSPKVNDGDQGRYELGLAQPSIWRSKRVGIFEVYLCSQCGLAEWYVRDSGELLSAHPELFKAIDGANSDEGGPYR